MSEENTNLDATPSPEEGGATPEATPEWFLADKYNSIEDQAKGYAELQKSFSQRSNEYKELEEKYNSVANKEVPESYEIQLNEQLAEAGVELSQEDPIYEMAATLAKENNYSQEEFSKMVNLYGEIKLAEAKAEEEFAAEQLKLLSNAEGRIQKIDDWAKANMDPDLYSGLTELTTTAKSVEALEFILDKATSGGMVAQETSSADIISEQELTEMQFAVDGNGNRLMSIDPEYAKKVRDLMNKKYGSAPHRVIVN